MRPVANEFPVSQEFGSYATGGVSPNQYGTEVEQLVYQYGNYQPYGHAGQDIACPIGTPVHAIADGTVLWADWGTNLPGDESDWGYRQRWYLYKTFPGIVTVIQHDGWISVYAHLSDAPLNTGDVVTEGQQIALSGNTRAPGVTLGAHLHVEALIDTTYTTGNGLIYGRTDPTPYYGSTGIAAMGSTITPIEQDWSDMATQQEFTAAVMDALNHEEPDGEGGTLSLYGLLRIIKPMVHDQPRALLDYETDRKGEFTGKTSLRGIIAYEDQKHIEALRATSGIPAGVLNQSFSLPDGTVTNLAGILTAIHAQPVTGAAVVNQSADPEAVVKALAAQLNK